MSNKKDKIKELTLQMLKESYEQAIKKVDKAINSGAIDTEAWDEKSNPMITPKAIVVAILTDEVHQYNCAGSSFEKQIKKESKNIYAMI
jgi:hypothetical protein